ncbi:CRISPR-associated endonuclease Cas3'' [Streptomyces sp. NBC_01207]|uniref:CRISPR-associated endonuclease Cas3'' n=1 Tax=Streptomyces sp. NBC_01207 TaxID=2903772 RepID=UPI002E13616D|nr:CRISPR-associated endonuclease Cas3'' [Streptomyces sp. NBC_01207]
MSSEGPLWAHSINWRGERHRLDDHLRGTGERAREHAEAFGCGEVAEFLGLAHDVGKGGCAWQCGLLRAEQEGGRVGLDHKQAGTVLAAKHLPWQFAAVVHGHHGGLPAATDLKALIKDFRSNGAHLAEPINRIVDLIPELAPTTPPVVPDWLSSARSDTALADVDLLTRMLFSSVVDADFLDTADHFRGRPRPRVQAPAMAELRDRYELRRKEVLAGRQPSPIDQLRTDVYDQAVTAATGLRGIYRLHVPTGGGKTISGGGYALHHAAAHGMRRVIVAVPFISITEQNADVYRRLLDPDGAGQPVVLEHHSSVDLDGTHGHWSRLAAENWDAPFVVTTTVQLFHSLFARTPSAMRKLHRLAGAVIVLDEVQALPDRLLTPILSALRGLVEHFGATVVLSSATQPELSAIPATRPIAGRTTNTLLADGMTHTLNEKLRRVRYEWRPDTTLAATAAEAVTHPQSLTVVNTTKNANTVHRTLTALRADAQPGEIMHLSTRMTGGHRRETIAAIRTRLAHGAPVTAVSTSLIEAGVDLDFPRLYRAWTLPESMLQAAGRCNRDGRLNGPGTVVIYDPIDGGQPFDRTYRLSMTTARRLFGPDLADPDNLDALAAYYRTRYRTQTGRHATDANGTTGETIEQLRTALDFPAVADAFQMIDDQSGSVVVIRTALAAPDQQALWDAIRVLRASEPTGPETLRSLQAHTASIPLQELEAAINNRSALLITGDLYEWAGPYHPDRGIEPPAA